MKTRIIIIVVMVFLALHLPAQPWIGNQFRLDTVVGLSVDVKLMNIDLIKTKVIDSTFYFVEQLAFQNKENNHNAIIYGISLADYAQEVLSLPFPMAGQDKEKAARNLWIYDFDISGDYMLITTQDELFLYSKGDDQNYKLHSTHKHRNMYMAFIHNGTVNYFEEDHDNGFKWFRKDIAGGQVELVTKLEYEAPHIVQIQPNRYIFPNNDKLFFLSTRNPQVDIYSKDGSFIQSVLFNIDNWHGFEDDYIANTLKVPYGIERIYAVKDDIFSYSYPKVLMPICGDLLLFYTQYDTNIGKSVLQYAIHNENYGTRPYSRKNHDDSVYVAAQFPFDLFDGRLDKGNGACGDRMIQLTYVSDVPWGGKTTTQYCTDLDNYFIDNDLKLGYKIMRYTGCGAIPANNGDSNTGRSRQCNGKRIMIFHKGLECSGCVKSLFRLLDNMCPLQTPIQNVYFHKMGAIEKRETANRISTELSLAFDICSSDMLNDKVLTKRLENIPDSCFPCIILYDNQDDYQLFRITDMFTPDNSLSDFREDFIAKLTSFLSNNE